MKISPGDKVRITEDPMTYLFVKWEGNKAVLKLPGFDKLKVLVNIYRVRKIMGK